MKDHPRGIVVHDGGDHKHAHVVFQRTAASTMTMWDTGMNYEKHERASKRMELEFGHEFVPGKHAKRDRKKQPEFPREKLTHAEAQQAMRTGMSKEERIAQLAEIRKPCDDGLAFKNALEEAGYLLARGDKRGLVLVDEQGEVYSLSRHVTDLKSKEFKAFIAPIQESTLPTVDEAKALQAERPVKAEKPPSEAAEIPRPKPPKKPNPPRLPP